LIEFSGFTSEILLVESDIRFVDVEDCVEALLAVDEGEELLGVELSELREPVL
jgi:hypothetical protein